MARPSSCNTKKQMFFELLKVSCILWFFWVTVFMPCIPPCLQQCVWPLLIHKYIHGYLSWRVYDLTDIVCRTFIPFFNHNDYSEKCSQWNKKKKFWRGFVLCTSIVLTAIHRDKSYFHQQMSRKMAANGARMTLSRNARIT